MQISIEIGDQENLASRLDTICELFVRNEDNQALQKLALVLMDFERLQYSLTADDQKTFQLLLPAALECMETKDYVRLMDILIFDIAPMFKE